MMRVEVDQSSVDQTSEHLEAVRQNILQGIRDGMVEGMQGLASAVISHLHGDPIQKHTGDLIAGVQNSVRVRETEAYIAGSVTASSAKYRNLGLWLEFGTRYPAGARMSEKYPKQFAIGAFTTANRKSIGIHGHGAFRIEPKPFFNPTFDDYYPTIMDGIMRRIEQACDA